MNKLTEGWGDCGKGLTDGECLHVVDSYPTTESDKTKGTTELLLSSGENKSEDLTIMGRINTPITHTKQNSKLIHGLF